jgi:hypothetical protein
MKNALIVCVSAVWAVMAIGCAPTRTWTARPEVRTFESPIYTAALEPLKTNGIFYSWFRLTVENPSDSPLEIDWNRTRYLFNGRDTGRFGFSGITPEQIRDADLPPDIVSPGDRLEKEIAPLKLIAFAPVRDTGVGISTKGISAGKLPSGENGIFLVVRHKGRELRKKLLLQIELQETD